MGVRKNFIYNSISTTAGYIFPLLTFPYISRVLGVTNIGICSYVDSIINYYILFSMMGIRIIGVREIAKHQEDKQAISQTFCSIIFLNIVLTIIFGTLLFISIQIVPQFSEHKNLMYIGLAKLIVTMMMIEWLFSGMEDFKYITIRGIIVKCFFVVSVFIFVKEPEDYTIYYFLLTASIGINAIVNCFYAKKYVKITIRKLFPLRFIKSSLTLGCYSFLTTMYTTFNISYLGFVTNVTEVGYYSTATKLHGVVLAFFSAFTSVLMPRISHLVGMGNLEEFKRKINLSSSIIIYFSFPLIVIGICYAPEIIHIISGVGFEKAVIPLIIVMPLVFVIGFEQILVKQVLMPLNMDRAILINSCAGAIVGIIVNILIVKNLGSIGSAIVWVVSELSVMTSALYFVRKQVQLNNYIQKIIINICYSVPAFVTCLIIRAVTNWSILAFFISVFLIAMYYGFLYVLVIKDEALRFVIPPILLRR